MSHLDIDALIEAARNNLRTLVAEQDDRDIDPMPPQLFIDAQQGYRELINPRGFMGHREPTEGYSRIARALIAQDGIDTNREQTTGGFTPLYIAAQQGFHREPTEAQGGYPRTVARNGIDANQAQNLPPESHDVSDADAVPVPPADLRPGSF